MRLRVDELTFDRWTQAMPGVALPVELATVNRPQNSGRRTGFVPPMVAASLALHGCADIAITLRTWGHAGPVYACFAISGDLGASVLREQNEVQIGLFMLEVVVDEVVRLVPVRPDEDQETKSGTGDLGPPPDPDDDHGGLGGVGHSGAAGGLAGVEVTVLGADEAVPSWRYTVVGGAEFWRRARQGPGAAMLEVVPDVRRCLADELRFALAGCLGQREQNALVAEPDGDRGATGSRFTTPGDTHGKVLAEEYHG